MYSLNLRNAKCLENVLESSSAKLVFLFFCGERETLKQNQLFGVLENFMKVIQDKTEGDERRR